MIYKKYTAGLLIIFFVALFLFTPNEAKASSNGTYTVSPVKIKKFKKSASFLTVTAKEKFNKDNKKTSKKKIRFKVSKKCKWRYNNLGIRFPENKGISKENYKNIRSYVYQVKGLPENGYYTLLIKVKKKKIIKVEFQCM